MRQELASYTMLARMVSNPYGLASFRAGEVRAVDTMEDGQTQLSSRSPLTPLCPYHVYSASRAGCL